MIISSQLLHRIADTSLPKNERAELRCRLAKELEELGNYDAAREAMGELWSRIGERPLLDDLEEVTAAEVLLRVGILTGWLGSVKQIEEAQESAKNLISESATRFEAARDEAKAAEAQMELGHCYWREGGFNEARVLLKGALSRLDEKERDLRAVTLLRLATVEKVTNRLSDALHLLVEAAPLFEASNNHTIKGRFHNEYAQVLRKVGDAEHRNDYIDRALIEYAAASYHFEQAGHTRYHACVENNLGFLFSAIGKFDEAHQHLDRAQALFTSMKDSVHTAQVDDTRARVLLAEGRVAEAERLVRSAVQILEKGGEQSLLAEALTTHGLVLARSGRSKLARLTLQRAVEAARNAGDSEAAGLAALTILEELAERLTAQDLSATFERAAELLSGTQHPATKDRLVSSARRVVHLAGVLPTPPDWKDFNLYEAVRRFEARVIERALRDAGGIVARAAQLLGINRQSLDTMLHVGRHKDLVHLRAPVEPRRKSLMFRDEVECPDTRVVTVFHVEDDALVAEGVRMTLEGEGWTVETCGDGATALERLAGSARYDVLIFDNRLPDTSGLELIRQTRGMAHRQQTPIIMLSASDVELQARRAGANAFLRKPEDLHALTETVARLLARKKEREGRGVGDV
jgi:CheY-like chemotaxis protein/Tfp pilus assembly protein PilF